MINYLLTTLGILMSVAFFTLFERKSLGLIHLRLGPNKIINFGILQPITDAMKLFTKENLSKSKNLKLLMILSPTFFILLSLLCWMFYFCKFSMIHLPFFIILVFSVLGLNVYPLLLMGFISFSKYSVISSYRCVSQTISYEISMIVFVFSYQLICMNLNLSMNELFFMVYPLMVFLLVLFFLWVTICLVESNRTPFDLAEGESELVSGFNTEYEGGLFSMIFISEYSSIIFLSSFTILIFFYSNIFLFLVLTFSFLMIWIRGTLPRFRYDILMNTAWKIFLPLSLLLFLMFL